MSVANTITYETLYEDVLQDRLDHPTTWKEMCDVTYTDTRVISTSYMSTTPSVQTVTRGTGHSMQTFAETAETLTISTGRDLGLFVDWADLAQSNWTKPAELFDRIGALLNEYIESAVLAQHGSWTNFGNSSIGNGGAATDPITVSASNIDDIIRGIKREIRIANGQVLMRQNGVGIVWRPADFEILEAFVQANGFATADQALKEGTVEGLHYLAVDHYWSNDYTAGHVFAGVKKVQRLGILRGTYGRAHTIEFPAGDTNTYLSGVSYYSRVDIGHLTPTSQAGLVFDVNVA
ncbi:MAG: hypothetical protein V4469_04385 [Patescibacteria group bacterium]